MGTVLPFAKSGTVVDAHGVSISPHASAKNCQLVRLSFARAKKLARAAECLVYSLTPSGFWAGNHPKNRGFVGILRGQKCLKRRFSWRSPVGERSRGARSMPRVFGRGSRSQPAALDHRSRTLASSSVGEGVGQPLRGGTRAAYEARRIDSRSWTSASGRLVGGKPSHAARST